MRISDWSSDVCSSDLIRVAKGSGTTVQEVNRLLTMHQEMEGAMKKIRKMGGLKGLGAMFAKGGMGGLGGMLGGGGAGGMPAGGLPGLPGGDAPKPTHGFENCLKKRSEEHKSDILSLIRISYAVFNLK